MTPPARSMQAGEQQRITAVQGLDVTVPNVARIYDWLLGGKDNFAADRRAKEPFRRAHKSP